MASHLDAISNACYSCSRGRRPRLFEDSAFDTTASTAEAISFFNDAGSVRDLENRNLTALSRQVCAKRT